VLIGSRGLLVLSALLAFTTTACCKSDNEADNPPAESPTSAPPEVDSSVSASASAAVSAAPTDSASATATTTTPPKASAQPPTNTSGANAVKSCCSALAAEAKRAKAPDKGPYESALGVCNSLVKKVESGATTPEGAKLTVRAQLQRAKTIPGACR